MSSTATHAGPSAAPRAQLDPRGARFAASLTTVVLAVALLLAPSPATIVLLAVQAVLFAVGAGAGLQRTPYSWLFRTVVRPRLGAPRELEDAAPPRFAQAVGLAFTVVALVGYVAGLDLLGSVATGFALAAAFLNAAFGLCLGCEVYLLLRRAAPATR
jgi:uncharacterized membrane protein YjdF